MSKFYVYMHRCPLTSEIVYVGKGTGGRAWDVTRSRGTFKEHQTWMLELIDQGYVPSDWVFIIHKGLDEREAFNREKEFLYANGHVRFNRYSGERQHQAKLSDQDAIDIYKLAWTTKEPHSSIAARYGVCRTVISMIKHKKQWKTTLAGVTIEN